MGLGYLTVEDLVTAMRDVGIIDSDDQANALRERLEQRADEEWQDLAERSVHPRGLGRPAR